MGVGGRGERGKLPHGCPAASPDPAPITPFDQWELSPPHSRPIGSRAVEGAEIAPNAWVQPRGEIWG